MDRHRAWDLAPDLLLAASLAAITAGLAVSLGGGPGHWAVLAGSALSCGSTAVRQRVRAVTLRRARAALGLPADGSMDHALALAQPAVEAGDPDLARRAADATRNEALALLLRGRRWHPAAIEQAARVRDLARADGTELPGWARWAEDLLAQMGGRPGPPVRKPDAELLADALALLEAGYTRSEAARLLALPSGDPRRPGADDLAAMTALLRGADRN